VKPLAPPLAETFRTDSVAPPRRLSFWNEVARGTFGDITIDASSDNFSAQLKRLRLRHLTLASVASSPASVTGARAVPGDGWFLLLNERGVSRMRQRGCEVCLRPGELTALRADQDYRIEFSQANTTLVLHIAGNIRGIDFDSHVTKRHGPSDVPLFIALLHQLARFEITAELPSFERLTLDAARLCWPARERFVPRQPIQLWERRIREYVEQHLSDPELGAKSIALRFGISPRFVHMVFARLGRTAGAFIQEQRLALAAVRLRAHPAEHVTHIAFDTGFSDLSQFCRAFRRRFGVSARAYRQTP
jgi:AraC-like DNA-binding protein